MPIFNKFQIKINLFKNDPLTKKSTKPFQWIATAFKGKSSGKCYNDYKENEAFVSFLKAKRSHFCDYQMYPKTTHNFELTSSDFEDGWV